MSLYYQSNADSCQSSLKRGKRMYPVVENHQMDVRPTLQSNRNHQSSYHYEEVVPNFSKLSLLPSEPVPQVAVNRNFDVPFLGNAPLVHDLDLPPPTPQIPASATVTSSSFSQCDGKYQKCSLNALPYNSNLLKRSKLPLSILIEPYPRAKHTDVPLISNGIITRCSRCKSFINPFIQFIDDGSKWKCNICNFDDNHVPTTYDWNNITRQRMDRWSVPELNYGCVDYVATSEFLARPPQPPVYVFVIDISSSAIETGMINTFAEALVECIDKIPNSDERTRIGFITVSQSIGFCSLASHRPEWLMVSDVDDVYLPRMTSELLVNLTEAKKAVLDLLENLKNMVSSQRFSDNNNCLGSALKAARLLLSSTGGKIVCFQASLPNIGAGSLPKSAFQRKKCTVTGDSLLFEPASDFYRTFSEDCIRSHICADMFVFGSQNVDVATLNVVPRFTGGQTHYYPGFNAKNTSDNQKLKHEIQKLLQEDMGLEALIRTKCSPGLVCKAFHGNFTSQFPDILVLPNVPRDGSYCIDLAIEGELYGDLAYIQTCMLYTSTKGERLLRVMTTCLPVVREMAQVFYNADQVSIARSIAHQAIERAVTYKIRDAKEYMVQQTVSIFKAYSKEIVGVVPSKSQQLNLCRSLCMLPALALSLIKSEAFNDRGFVPVNISTQSALLLRTLPTSLWLRYVYPSCYSLHNMPIQSGNSDVEGNVVMPPRLNLSLEKLERHGCYLLENGQRILIWIGKAAVPQLCLDLLNVPNINEVISGQISALPTLDNLFSKRVTRIIEHLRTSLRCSNFYPTLYVVKEEDNSVLNNWFMTHLLEDEQQLGSHRREMIPNSTMSYAQWLSFIKASM